jgi:hypothetical protein
MGQENEEIGMSLRIKAEWWELWCERPGSRPIFIAMYGEAVPPWIPEGCYPTRALAREEKRRRCNRFDRILHVRRYK